MHRRAVRRLLAGAVLIGTVGIVPAVTASPASAATCSGYGCDGTDPAVTGCSANANDTSVGYVTNSAGQDLAKIQLRWSLTCHTNWGKITKTAQGSYIAVYAYRPSPYATTSTYGGYSSSYYGDQLYGDNLTVCVVGYATDATNPQSPMYSYTLCG
ncbi:DUF2690 domain-containing protein [Sphaerisporangium sp. NPDC088356]|uniref:DUF2690 domain-containing protein n=1 Tax=Sphaerisporangium sp. NPDC088356 TaxID=3154871 RepID=UPI0034325E1F